MWFLAVVLVLIILILLYQVQVVNLHDLNRANISDINWKTGDLLFMRCDYTTLIEPAHFLALNLSNWAISGGLETHVAMIIKIDNTPYVYQVEYKPTWDISTQSYRWKAPVIMNLQDYIMGYVGEVQYLSCKQELDLPQTLDFVKQNQQIEFTINQLRWANTLFKIPSKPDPRYKFCVQLITDYLQHMNIIQPSMSSHHMNPNDLKTLVLNSNFYDSPILVNNAYLNLKINDCKETFIPL
jgi:hypothetical protein